MNDEHREGDQRATEILEMPGLLARAQDEVRHLRGEVARIGKANQANPGSTESLQFYGDHWAVFAKLAEAQGAFATPQFDSEVDFQDKSGRRIHFKFASLLSLVAATRPALTAAGLSFSQWLVDGPEFSQKHLFTILAGHGGMIKATLTFMDTGNVKAMGSDTTYRRRYALQSALGIAAEEGTPDDASQDADHPQPEEKAPAKRPSAKRRTPGKPKEEKPALDATNHEGSPGEEPPPPTDEDSPTREPADDKPMTDKQNTRLKEQFVILAAVRKVERIGKVEAGKLCKEVTGVNPPELTLELAEKLIEHMEGLTSGE